MSIRITATGAPGAGKTTVIDFIKRALEQVGCRIDFVAGNNVEVEYAIQVCDIELERMRRSHPVVLGPFKSSTPSNVGTRPANLDSREIRAVTKNEVSIEMCMNPPGIAKLLSLSAAGALYVELGVAIKRGLEKEQLINGTFDHTAKAGLRSRNGELFDLVTRGIISLDTYYRELMVANEPATVAPKAPLDTVWCSQCETHVIAICGLDGDVHCPYCNRPIPPASK